VEGSGIAVPSVWAPACSAIRQRYTPVRANLGTLENAFRYRVSRISCIALILYQWLISSASSIPQVALCKIEPSTAFDLRVLGRLVSINAPRKSELMACAHGVLSKPRDEHNWHQIRGSRFRSLCGRKDHGGCVVVDASTLERDHQQVFFAQELRLVVQRN